MLQRIKSALRYAVAHERIESNPMLDLVPSEILKPRKVQHRPASAERDLPEFLDKLDAYQGDTHTLHALRLLMLTAVRPGEVRGARWTEFDLPAAHRIFMAAWPSYLVLPGASSCAWEIVQRQSLSSKRILL